MRIKDTSLFISLKRQENVTQRALMRLFKGDIKTDQWRSQRGATTPSGRNSAPLSPPKWNLHFVQRSTKGEPPFWVPVSPPCSPLSPLAVPSFWKVWLRPWNWHFKFNIFFNIQETFRHQNDFHIMFLSKVIDILISNCLITLKINYQDMVIDLYINLLKILKTIGLKPFSVT